MTRKIWSLLFRRVRWSDGAVASFWFDRLALGLLALSVVLEILGMAVAWGLYDSPVLGLVTMLPVGLALFVAAKVRLRLAVDRAERDGISDRDASVPVIFERFVNISRWQDRLIEWGAWRCEMAEQKFLARADAATAKGDDRSAARAADTSSRPACSCCTTSAAVGTRRMCVHGPVAVGCRLGVTVTNLATLAVNGTVEGVGRPALGSIAFASVPERSSAFVGAS